ncbi:MAG: nucleotidyl transferase AbiEii/AbiGii toxin family protein [Rhodocyclales bacterium]|nr:nucleotidyl transferase AbiEii/AbiGii toxin family protein [Rhodocyclales bacterium]
MNNISSSMTLKPDRPVDSLTLMVIDEIQQAATRHGAPVFLVGAVARIILLENVHGLRAGRATSDVDFAFALDDWEQFQKIKTTLLENSRFNASEHVAHRLYFRAPGLEHSYKVDLIPFGGVETSPNTIAWPPDMAIMMNVAGFSDAFAAAVSVEVSTGVEIAVASLPGIAILKLFAWADRRQDNPKDALDLLTLLRSYHEAGNENRIYEDANALAALEAVGYDPELAGAWLLGNDAATIASTATVAGLKALLNGTTKDRLVEDMSRGMKGWDDSLEHPRRLLEQFTKGFTA